MTNEHTGDERGDTAARKPGFFRAAVDFALNQDLDAAIAEQLVLAERDPRNPKPYVALGAFFHMQGRLDDAALMFRHALRLDPDSDLGHQYLGQLLAARGQMEAAWHHAREATRCGNRLLLDMLRRYHATPELNNLD